LKLGRFHQAETTFRAVLAKAEEPKYKLAEITLDFSVCLFIQGKNDEALRNALTAEKQYWMRSVRKDEFVVKFCKNLVRCSHLIQGLFIVHQDEVLKALDVAERNRALTMRLMLESGGRSAGVFAENVYEQMRQFCIDHQSSVLYLSYVKSSLIFCWFVSPSSDQRKFFLLGPRTAAERSEFHRDSRAYDTLIQIAGLLFGYDDNNVTFRKGVLEEEEEEDAADSGEMESGRCKMFEIGLKLWDTLRDAFQSDASARIVIIPERRLFAIPYCTLGHEHDEVEQHGVQSYPLLEHYSISISFSHLSLYTKRKTPTCGNAAIVISNPEGNLPVSEIEGAMVASCIEYWHGWTVKHLTGKQCDSDQVKQQLETCRLFHIAAHGTQKEDELYVSAGDLRSFNGASLHATDIQKLNLLSVDLAFLNCCYTGRGTHSYDGLIGLGRAFIYAGARAVVIYEGAVPDTETTCEFVKAFYENFSVSHKADEALQFAQRRMIEEHKPQEFWSLYYVLVQGM
jgi:hypothetical protein